MTTLFVILPCYNEEDVIESSSARIDAILSGLIDRGLISSASKALYVDDGSGDSTWDKIVALARDNARIRGLRLSRNFGHQLALSAGMSEADGKCDACISIDADLQQDPEAIATFVERFRDGADVVLGVRADRATDGWLKRTTARGFYSLAKRLGVRLVPGHADYRLLSARALSTACQYQENDPFHRGIVPLLGFRVETVAFDVSARTAGRSKYTVRKMLRLALSGITSFSVVPLRMIGILGIFTTIVSIALAGYAFWVAVFTTRAVPGWASTVVPIYLIAGLQMISFGVIGEYVGRIFLEVKNRPRYIVMERTDA